MDKIGVSQKVIVLNDNGKILAIRRSKTAPLRPLHWDLPGGDLDFGEDPIEGIIRETKEETGLVIENPEPFDVEAQINPGREFWVTIAYKAKCNSRDVNLSYEHDEFRWITAEEFLKLKSSEKLQRFIKKLIPKE